MALSNGPNLGLLVDGALGEEHYDEVLAQWRGLDALVQSTVITRNTLAPPGSPTDGDLYIVPTGASGDWSTHDGKIARYSSALSDWEFYTPKQGWKTFVTDEGIDVRFDGTDWVEASSAGGGSGDVGSLRYMGTFDLSTDPDFPAANKGDLYSVSVRGHIGGVNGQFLRYGDSFYCRTNGRPSGSDAAVGLHWVTVRRGAYLPVQVLVDAPTIGYNCANTCDARVVLAGNRTLAVPTNVTDGDRGMLRVKQDATGGRTLAYAAGWKWPGGTVPVLSTGANKLDIISWQYDAADNSFVAVMNKDFS